MNGFVTALERSILALFLLAMLAWIIANAWVTEDAYISFRYIDNFLSGYGLRWNIHERVQAYTHPLWLLLHIPVMALWGNLFHTDIFLSVLCTLGAVLVGLAAGRNPAWQSVCCFLLPLTCSQAWMDYTTSGLEIPLSCLLYAGFVYVLAQRQTARHFGLELSLLMSLGMFNRLDTLLLYAPLMAGLLITRRVTCWQLMLGSLPLLVWLAFSLFYYGFLLPNTAYAKLETGLPLTRYLYQGLHYARYTLEMDAASAGIMLSCVAFIIPAWRTKAFTPALLAVGILLNMAYVVRIGGDYMIGRFWALPVFASAMLWQAFLPPLKADRLFAIACAWLMLACVGPMMQQLRAACPPCVVPQGRLVDARLIFGGNRLVAKYSPLKIRDEGMYQFGRGGKQIARMKLTEPRKLVYIGMAGYYAGPHTLLVDEVALADPLLAHLPASTRRGFFAGHFGRDIPQGYLEALRTGDTSGMDENLAAYYEPLHHITSGALLDKDRLKAIIEFNLGYYDHWKDAYLKTHAP